MYQVLIITNDTTDAKLLQDTLSQAKNGSFQVEWVTRLHDGLARLRTGKSIDIMLVDLSLPDSKGIATLDRLFSIVPKMPVLVLVQTDNDILATDIAQHGAQGCLVRDHFNNNLIPQTLSNIIQRKNAEESLFIEKNRAEITLNSISDAVICTDMSGNVNYMNTGAESMTGWPREEAHGQSITKVMQIINKETHDPVLNPIEWVLKWDETMGLTAGTVLIRRDGSETAIEDSAAPIHDVNGKIVGAVIVFHDISAAQGMITKMAHLAQHDSLTNLPNRVLLDDRITQAISIAKRRDTQLSLLFLDLDNFKHINDSLGHENGDKLLQSVAQRLCACVRHSDTVSRLGGDEFVILMTQDKQAQNAALTADKILAALSESHAINGHELHVTTSIGISIYPTDGQDTQTLIKNADIAMYHAKEKGRNNYQFFKDEMNVLAVERQVIETHLRRAVAEQEFMLFYQPRVNLENGMITGAEALLRWAHPDWGMLQPNRFVRIAEDSGLIVPIGRWALREACTQARHWENAGLELESIAVNISAQELYARGFVGSVQAILHETELDPCCLQLEIPESVLMRDATSSVMILRQLKNIGIQLAIEDFGTGSSSLSCLHRFSIDILKIDSSLVQGIGRGNNDSIIINAIITLGASLKQRVIAEGVETQEQLAFLKQQHCNEVQGYFLSRPTTAAQFAQLLATGLYDKQWNRKQA